MHYLYLAGTRKNNHWIWGFTKWEDTELGFYYIMVTEIQHFQIPNIFSEDAELYVIV
jgi:hypothetical protein